MIHKTSTLILTCLLSSLLLISFNAAAEDDCVAGVPSDGMLNANSPQLKNLKLSKSQYHVTETAELTQHPGITIELSRGGCAHYGVSFTYVIEGKIPLDDMINKVQLFLQDTPMTEEGNSWKADFESAIAKYQKDPSTGTTFPNSIEIYLEPGYSTVYISANPSDKHKGKIELSLLFDIAL